jgi:hypothetical protein
MNRTRAERRYNRYVKAMRRIRGDRAEHGSDLRCSCFDPDGREFARFADHPKIHSGPCCGNPRRHFGAVTPQELRAPKVHDWDDPTDP